MNDFETRLATLLNEQIDADIEAQHTTRPAFRTPPAQTAARRWFGPDRAPWVLPLLAAACVVAIAGGTVGAIHVLADNKPEPPGHSTVTPPPTSATTSVPSLPHPSNVNPDLLPTVEFGAARIAVPRGLVATPVNAEQPDEYLRTLGVHAPGAHQPNGLYLEVDQLLTPPASFDPDVYHWAFGNIGEWCGSGHVTKSTEQYGERSFGGRPAEWRWWRSTCSTGRTLDVEQYVTATAPVFALFSYVYDGTAHTQLAAVARNSDLPPQSRPLRVADRGVLRRAEPGATGVTITIDRVRYVTKGGQLTYVPDGTASATYLVPTAVYDTASPAVSTGDVVSLMTDGNVVTRFGKSY